MLWRGWITNWYANSIILCLSALPLRARSFIEKVNFVFPLLLRCGIGGVIQAPSEHLLRLLTSWATRISSCPFFLNQERLSKRKLSISSILFFVSLEWWWLLCHLFKNKWLNHLTYSWNFVVLYRPHIKGWWNSVGEPSLPCMYSPQQQVAIGSASWSWCPCTAAATAASGTRLVLSVLPQQY